MQPGMTRRHALRAGVGLALVPGFAGCADELGETRSDLRVMVPNSPGSGYDQTGRDVAQTLEDVGLTARVETFNVLGSGGTVGLARLLNERGNGDLMMTMGLGLVGARYAHASTVSLSAATPLARLFQEPEGIVVPATSPYDSLEEVLTAWRAAPRSVIVAGGSFPGGPDHLFAMELARAAGVAPERVIFRSHDGGGRLVSTLLGGKVDFATSGLAELHQQVENGQLRVLATSGTRRESARPRVPTLRESGLDLSFTNWRGLLAPPALSGARQAELIGMLERMRDSSEWKALLSSRAWVDAWLPGEDYAAFLRAQDGRVRRTMKELPSA